MRTILCPALSLLILSASLANAGSTLAPEEVIRTTTTRVVERLEKDPDLSEDPDRLYAVVNDIILPQFDFNRISKRVLGKYWRRASEDQRRHFVSEFQTLLIKTYAIALASYDNQGIVYGPHRPRSETEISIRTEITGGSGPGIPVTYELHLMNGSWKVYDVVVDGVSLSLTYRNEFRSLVRQQGIDALIARMTAHNLQTR